MNRTLIVGDTSGYLESLKELILKAKPTRVYCLGDIIDRGPESKEMIQFLMDNDIKSVLGNHEHMFISFYEEIVNKTTSRYNPLIWIYQNGGSATLRSYGIDVPEKNNNTIEENQRCYDLIKNQIDRIDKKHIEFLKTFPLFYELENYILTHAPIPKLKNRPDFFDLKEMNRSERILELGSLWNRSDPVKQSKIQIYGHQNRKKVIVHTDKNPVGEYVDELDLSIVKKEFWGVCLDTYAHGYLSGLVLEDLSLHYSFIDKS